MARKRRMSTKTRKKIARAMKGNRNAKGKHKKARGRR